MVPTLVALLALGQSAGPVYSAITPDSCLAHVRFLASDRLRGRGTPSEGLEIAADYIAAQFQVAGLEPPGPDGYFQAAQFENRRTAAKGSVRNVLGVVRGSDPTLRETYVLVTAHYDHLGAREGEGDQIYNGANDNASGTAGVIELARALARSKPKRTLVFLCFWGEEAGLQGSRHYAENPVFPLARTIANVNLEQIGRTDDSEGPRVAEFNVTGFDFSNLAGILRKAAEPAGVKATMHPQLSTPYFSASDNAALAAKGVVAHTVSTAYQFPDYHRPGDEWDKIDAKNMAKIVEAVGRGIWAIANGAEPIRWQESNPRVKRYADAWKTLTGGTPPP